MMKSNRWKLWGSSVVIILPSLIGLFWQKTQPESLAALWGADGLTSGWNGGLFSLLGIPMMLLAVHWFCIYFTLRDQSDREQSQKVLEMVWWICPMVSLFIAVIFYLIATGKPFQIQRMIHLFTGLLFLIIGNYLPKCRQNYTIGIRVSWTLASEENWNATHRFAGKVWVLGGLLLLVSSFVPQLSSPWLLPLVIVFLGGAPIAYSYLYHKKQKASGFVPEKTALLWKKPQGRIVVILLGCLTVFLVGLLFTGDLEVRWEESSFTVAASYWADLTVDYADVSSVEYRKECRPGFRTMGFGSARLLMGTFQSEELGTYTRYSYTKNNACVLLKVLGKTLVIGGADPAATREIYEELLLRTGVAEE